MHEQVISFWFEELEPAQWWKKDPAFDQLIAGRFGSVLQQAACGDLWTWRQSPRGRLAEVIVLDQFSRNIHRDTPAAFAQDGMALVLAQEAISCGASDKLSQQERNFLYMPFMHSESRWVHEQAERLFRENGLQQNYEFELKHKVIIDRFGRYPHRNGILRRESTSEEIEFLKQPDSSF